MLVSRWPEWMRKIIEYSKLEGATRPSIAQILADYNDKSVTNTSDGM